MTNDRQAEVVAFLLDVEHFAKWASQPLTPAMAYVQDHANELAGKARALRAALAEAPAPARTETGEWGDGMPTCPRCDGQLVEVANRSAYLNDDQAASQRAGDFYCEKCPPNGRSEANRYCYWWKREIAAFAPAQPREAPATAKKCEGCPPTPAEGRGEEAVARLARFIMENIPGEPSRSEGAVDCAIRLLARSIPHGDGGLTLEQALAKHGRWQDGEACDECVKMDGPLYGCICGEWARQRRRDGRPLSDERSPAHGAEDLDPEAKRVADLFSAIEDAVTPACEEAEPRTVSVGQLAYNIASEVVALVDKEIEARGTPPAPAEGRGEEAERAYAKTFGEILARDICESEPSGVVIEAQDRLQGTDAATFLVIEPKVLAEFVARNVDNAFHDGEIVLRSLPHGDGGEEAVVTAAIRDVLAERAKQRRKWGDSHDDDHKHGELTIAAAELAVAGTDARVDNAADGPDPWGLVRKNPNRRDQLVIAAALLLAEIERKDRAIRSLPHGDGGGKGGR